MLHSVSCTVYIIIPHLQQLKNRKYILQTCLHTVYVTHAAKLSSETTVMVIVENGYLWENFHGSMLVDSYCKSTWVRVKVLPDSCINLL